jgi:8-oxo-dGTP pyrophosphatase MutT (NUDIX family)
MYDNLDILQDVGRDFFLDMQKRAAASPGEVVMVVRRPGGRVLLSTKSFYPSDIYRLPTGKLDPGEDPEPGFIRETWEETGFHPKTACRLGTILATFRNREDKVSFPSFIFASEEFEGTPASQDPDESITGFLDADRQMLAQVERSLKSMNEPWSDWGCWRAAAHKFVFEHI